MRDFEHGPFKLGSLQLPSNFIAAAWVVISTVRPCCHTAGAICTRDSLPIAPALKRDLQETDRQCHSALCEAHMPTNMQHDKQNLFHLHGWGLGVWDIKALPVQLLLSLHMPAAHHMGCILEDDSVSDCYYRQVVRELRSLASSSN